MSVSLLSPMDGRGLISLEASLVGEFNPLSPDILFMI